MSIKLKKSPAQTHKYKIFWITIEVSSAHDLFSVLLLKTPVDAHLKFLPLLYAVLACW